MSKEAGPIFHRIWIQLLCRQDNNNRSIDKTERMFLILKDKNLSFRAFHKFLINSFKIREDSKDNSNKL